MKKQAWAVAIVLVVSVVAAVGTAQAQQVPRYERMFTLPFEVRWGSTVLAPGNYSLTLDPASANGPVVVQREGHAKIILMPQAIARHASGGENVLIVKWDREVRIVEALYLADLDLVLYYHRNAKSHLEGDAQRVERVPILWIPQGACPEYCIG